jgi:hypothetical protein
MKMIHDLSYKYCFASEKVFVTLLFLMVLFLQGISAQETIPDKKITVNYAKEPLRLVLIDITKKSGARFSYNPRVLPVDTLISYKCTEKNVSQVLSDVFETTGIYFEFVEGHVVLKLTSEEVQLEPVKVEKPLYFTLSGYITDAKNQEALIGANIFDVKSRIGTTTNNYGFFSLTLPEGEYQFETSYLGYTLSSLLLHLNENYKWDIALKPSVSMVEEIVVVSNDRESYLFNSLAAQTEIKPFEVKKQTAALGETDMLKSFDNLPGISFQSDGSSYFYVRGGNRDQNLILLDEAPIYNPSHMLGLFTPIIPDAVKTTNIYKADFPIQYGGRLSSLIDIRTRDGNMERFSGSASVGLVATRLSIEGPLKKQQSSYFVSYRRSHLGALIMGIQPNIKELYFTDFTTKFNIRLGKKDRLFLTLYNGKDKIIAEESKAISNGLQWGNTSLTLRWNHLFGDRLFANTTFYTSKYNYFLYTDYNSDLYWNSHISSTHLKTEFTWYLNPKNQINYGVKLGTYFFNPGNFNGKEVTSQHTVSTTNSNEFILYAGNEYKASEKLLLNYGMRFSRWSNLGEAFVVKYENFEPVDYESYAEGERYYSNNSVEPRISLSYKTSDFSSVKASYNRTLQHINLINNSISPLNSLEVWLPSGPNIKPQKADGYNLGYVHSWPVKSLEFNADVYYKKLYNQVGYAYHANTLLNPLLEGELRQGNGLAYGFELLLKKTQGRFTGQLAYGFTRSLLTIN